MDIAEKASEMVSNDAESAVPGGAGARVPADVEFMRIGPCSIGLQHVTAQSQHSHSTVTAQSSHPTSISIQIASDYKRHAISIRITPVSTDQTGH